MLTPMDIHNREFKRSFRGYNEDEIDDFLDQIVNDYEKLCRDNETLRENLERSKKDLTQYKQLEKNLQDTLLVAQKTADEVTTAAKKNAEELKLNTQQECENLRRQTELAAKEKMNEAEKKVRDIVAEYDRLVREKRQTLAKWRFSLQSELALLDESAEQLPDPTVTDTEIEVTTSIEDSVQDQDM